MEEFSILVNNVITQSQCNVTRLDINSICMKKLITTATNLVNNLIYKMAKYIFELCDFRNIIILIIICHIKVKQWPIHI